MHLDKYDKYFADELKEDEKIKEARVKRQKKDAELPPGGQEEMKLPAGITVDGGLSAETLSMLDVDKVAEQITKEQNVKK